MFPKKKVTFFFFLFFFVKSRLVAGILTSEGEYFEEDLLSIVLGILMFSNRTLYRLIQGKNIVYLLLHLMCT